MFNNFINELYQDPILFTGFENITDRILFDCGYMFSLPLKDIQRISSVFVSHTHFDHFIGFDHILRLCIEQDRVIELYGPEGFIEQVAGKLSGYSWNLCEDLGLDFVVREYNSSFYKEIVLKGNEAYKINSNKTSFSFSNILKDNDVYRVETALLDHKITSMAFSVIEKDFLKVKKEVLLDLGIKGGPWLGALREEFLSGSMDAAAVIEFPSARIFTKKELSDKLFTIKKGKKVSYVVDTIFSKDTENKILDLIKDSDEFYCECVFLEEDADKACLNHHLTAKQAGILARLGNVKKLIPIHMSKRYSNRYWELIKEAKEEFSEISLPEKYRD